MTTPDYSKGNEKLVFYLQHPGEANVAIDESYQGYVVIHLTVTQDIRNKLISALNHLNIMDKEDGVISSYVLLQVHCAVYYQTIYQIGHTKTMSKHGMLVDEFPEIVKYETRKDEADLLIGLPIAGQPNSMSVEIQYNGFSERFKTASTFLSGLAQQIFDTMLT